MAVDDVYVGTANAGGNDFELHFVRGGSRFGPIRQFYVAFAGLCLDNRFHRLRSSSNFGSRMPQCPAGLEEVFFGDHQGSL